MRIEIEKIEPAPYSFRSSWDEGKMEELARSVAERGVIVPIKVRPISDEHGGDEYEIVYGHRRVEAARRAGLTEIPALVEGLGDDESLVQALIENVQREDLGPMDVARALKALKEATGWSNKEIDRQGIISNVHAGRLLALLEEPGEIQDELEGVTDGNLSEYHVRQVREAGTTPEERVAIIEKAAKEVLTADQTRRIAECVVAAPSERAKEEILEWEYSPFLHDPERIKQQAEEGLLHRDDKPAKDEAWKKTPEVKTIIDELKRWREAIQSFQSASEIGKFSPEAQSFVARRALKLAEELRAWAESLGG
jgi:ParB/RepB/Spo0J family partition protein